jgi:hypothetical protein
MSSKDIVFLPPLTAFLLEHAATTLFQEALLSLSGASSGLIILYSVIGYLLLKTEKLKNGMVV